VYQNPYQNCITIAVSLEFHIGLAQRLRKAAVSEIVVAYNCVLFEPRFAWNSILYKNNKNEFLSHVEANKNQYGQGWI
jgi:hypothetical protein